MMVLRRAFKRATGILAALILVGATSGAKSAHASDSPFVYAALAPWCLLQCGDVSEQTTPALKDWRKLGDGDFDVRKGAQDAIETDFLTRLKRAKGFEVYCLAEKMRVALMQLENTERSHTVPAPDPEILARLSDLREKIIVALTVHAAGLTAQWKEPDDRDNSDNIIVGGNTDRPFPSACLLYSELTFNGCIAGEFACTEEDVFGRREWECRAASENCSYISYAEKGADDIVPYECRRDFYVPFSFLRFAYGGLEEVPGFCRLDQGQPSSVARDLLGWIAEALYQLEQQSEGELQSESSPEAETPSSAEVTFEDGPGATLQGERPIAEVDAEAPESVEMTAEVGPQPRSTGEQLPEAKSYSMVARAREADVASPTQSTGG